MFIRHYLFVLLLLSTKIVSLKVIIFSCWMFIVCVEAFSSYSWNKSTAVCQVQWNSFFLTCTFLPENTWECFCQRWSRKRLMLIRKIFMSWIIVYVRSRQVPELDMIWLGVDVLTCLLLDLLRISRVLLYIQMRWPEPEVKGLVECSYRYIGMQYYNPFHPTAKFACYDT